MCYFHADNVLLEMELPTVITTDRISETRLSVDSVLGGVHLIRNSTTSGLLAFMGTTIVIWKAALPNSWEVSDQSVFCGHPIV